MSKPRKITVEVCSECEELWSRHMTMSDGKVKKSACIALLMVKNQGPGGPPGPMGPAGSPGYRINPPTTQWYSESQH